MRSGDGRRVGASLLLGSLLIGGAGNLPKLPNMETEMTQNQITTMTEHYSISELRLNLTSIVSKIQREKIFIIIRRRFDVVAALIPVEEYSKLIDAKNSKSAEQIKSIREAREGIAGFIDRVLTKGTQFLLLQRGEPVAVLVPISDINAIDPELYSGVASGTRISLAAATSPVESLRTPVSGETEVVMASDLLDQNDQACVKNGILILRTRSNRTILSGVIEPSISIEKLMIKVQHQLITDFSPITNKAGFFDLGEVELVGGAAADDIKFVRLA